MNTFLRQKGREQRQKERIRTSDTITRLLYAGWLKIFNVPPDKNNFLIIDTDFLPKFQDLKVKDFSDSRKPASETEQGYY